MITPEELERRIVQMLSEGHFTEHELLLRRIGRVARDSHQNGEARAGQMLQNAGFMIGSDTLLNILTTKPWLFATLEPQRTSSIAKVDLKAASEPTP